MAARYSWVLAIAVAAAISCAGRVAAQPPASALEFRGKDGQYTIRVTGISRVRQFHAQGEDSFSLGLSVSLDLKNPVLGTAWPSLGTAADDTGASLLQPAPGNAGAAPPLFFRESFHGGFGRHPDMNTFTLLTPAEKATRIAAIKGTIILAVSTGTEEIRFDQPLEAHDVAQEKAGVKATLKSAKQEGGFTAVIRLDGLRAGMRAGATTGGGQGTGPVWGGMGPQPQFVLLGADGAEHNANGWGGSGDGKGTDYRVSWGLPQGFAAQALVVRFVKGQKNEEIPFEFQDIPLP